MALQGGPAVVNQPVVIDNGTGTIKAGFAGADMPKVVFGCVVGRPKHTRAMLGGALEGSEAFVGKKVEDHRGALRLSHPMKHGVVEDWQDMETVWRHVYTTEHLNVDAEEHPVLLTEAPLNPYKHRQKCAEVLFETFGVPALFVAPQAILALYASGRTTGVVLDVGDGVTHCVPVYEGYALNHAISRMDVAGRDVTERMQLLLRRTGLNLSTSAERETVRHLKEESCYVAFNPAKEEETMIDATSYRLPDGQVVKLGKERFRAPEILFRPELIGEEYGGVHDCLLRTVMKADMDMRRQLFSQIVLSGGSTLFPGFGERLLSEVKKQAPKNLKIRISAPPERRYSTWIGGSILASLATFKTMWATKAQYEEEGAILIDSMSM